MAKGQSGPAASGEVDDSGNVRCSCGKKVGHVGAEGVEFWCPACKKPVEVRFAEMKMGGLMAAITGINAAVGTLQQLGKMVAELQP